MSIIRILLFSLSILGYGLFLSNRFKMNMAYTITISTSWLIVAEYCFALLGMLQPASWVLFSMGLLCFVFVLIKDRTAWKLMLCPSFFLFVGLCAVVVLILIGEQLAFVDDFNHWGTMARFLAENHRLPGAEDTLIQFTSYPPGAALWIYYFSEITGNQAESFFLIAQAILICILLLPFSNYLTNNAQSRSRMLAYIYIYA